MKTLLLLLLTSSASANSIGTIQGKLVSVTEKDIAIQIDKNTYFIKKSALLPQEAGVTSQIGKIVAVHIPLEGIDAMKRDK